MCGEDTRPGGRGSPAAPPPASRCRAGLSVRVPGFPRGVLRPREDGFPGRGAVGPSGPSVN